MCLSKGHQTLSDEVSERTCSRMLKLEKENQSLSKTIEELRAASINNNTRTKHGHRLERDVFQETCSIGNLNLGEPTNCHQLFPAEDLEQVQSEILLTENPDLLARVKGQLEDVDQGDHSKEGMSDLKVLENNHNRRHCFVGSRDHSPGSKDCSPCHDSIFKGLPTHSSYARKHTQLEAKCRALDPVNQHQQTSLDNTGRFCCSNITNQTKRFSNASVKPTLRLHREDSSASRGRGSGAGGREPDSAGQF